MNKKTIKLIKWGLACTLILGSATVITEPTQAKAKTQDTQFTQAATKSLATRQKEALNYLNKIRAKMGLQPLKLNAYLNKAAQNHANYLKINNAVDHGESKKDKGYTGIDSNERIKAVGGSERLYTYSRETISFDTNNLTKAVQGFMDTAYHREIMIDNRLDQIGMGVAGNNVVFNYGDLVDSDAEDLKSFSAYPYNGMTNTPIGFYGFEDPNPLDQFKVDKSGYIISYQSDNTCAYDISVTIKDSSGAKVPFYVEHVGLVWFFYPKYELAYNEKYTVTVEYREDYYNPSSPLKKDTWSFTTKPKPKINLAKDETLLKINGKYVSSELEDELTTYTYYYNPIVKRSKSYINAKFLFERLNGRVTYDSKTKYTTVKTAKKEIKFKVGYKYAYVNGKKVALSTAPISLEGAVHVPHTLLKETLGAKVIYSSKNKLTTIDLKLDDPYGLKSKFSIND
ncbi:stalk domain-containing protein [Bacillus massilinigeriensis]|uniref:stalk domain-containing protein n=1 Tax=Bacillus massilionigeriensis TaxID=1805475 RepID=UPI00096B2E23|nr:CAP domain-containing protein [Bacillus massilionigeriensis]